ncbi:MAG: POTRA domain-containing protein [Bryobacteraceae bacterium]
MLLLVFTLFFGAVAIAQEAPANNPTSYAGRPIVRIDFDPPDQPIPQTELFRLLPLRPGSVVTSAAIRATLQRLYETGRFSKIAIDADGVAEGNGVVLKIITEQSLFIGGVTVEGASEPPNENQLAAATKLELGMPFAGSAVSQAVESMQERLRANGFYDARIQYRLERDEATSEMNIFFDVNPGDRARFEGVQVGGGLTASINSIVRATRWHRGILFVPLPGWRQVTEARVQTGVDRVRQNLRKANRLLARVTLVRLDYRSTTNTVTPWLDIENGPAIDIRTSGANVSKGRLRQLIPVYEERTVDRSLLVEGSRNLTNYFQSQGYFDVSVDFTEHTEANGSRVIDYSVLRNARHKLVGIEISGNRFFDQATIRERLSLREAGRLRQRYGRYSQRLRDQDRDAIRDLYRSNGFRDVSVNTFTADDYRGRHDDLGVRFEIQEGPQWFVNSVQFDGASDDDEQYLRGMIQSTEGQAFSEAGIAADRDAILAYYLNNGFPDATFDWTQTPSEQANRVDLRFVIHAGERRYVRDVLVRGLDTTKTSLVANRLGVRAGDPISQTQIAQSQQRLYDLGIFSKVQTALQNPDGMEESKYVLFHLDEASRYSFNVGIGAQLTRIGSGAATFDAPAGNAVFSPRLSLGVSRLNLLGLGHTLSLQTLASLPQQRAIGTYLIPQFAGNDNLSITASTLFDNSRDVSTYKAQRIEGSLQLAQRLTRANTLQYRFSFRRVTVSDLNIDPGLVPLLSQPDRVGIFSMTFIQDRRDNPVDSRGGILNTIDMGVSLPQFGSVSNYTRLLLRNSTYHKINRELTIARSLQFGYIQRLGGALLIPLPERFFAGGASSQRAFPDNQAGPRDIGSNGNGATGFPLGGTAMFFHSTELRFPLIGDNVGGVLFHDMGNVYSDIRNVSFRFRQQNLTDFNYMVQAAGFGIRYKTPVGPIRIDLSFSPNPPKFNGFSGTLQDLITCSQVRSCATVPRSISNFQFHFSLGQTF